jgi:hypothetical protein
MFSLKTGHLIFLFSLLLGLNACSKSKTINIVVSKDASQSIKLTAEDLKEDLENVLNKEVVIKEEIDEDETALQLLLITPDANKLMLGILDNNGIKLSRDYPGLRGGFWHKINENTIVFGGSDSQGLQYAVYDYCAQVLGIDPLSYWSGQKPEPKTIADLLLVRDKIIDPPFVPLMGYFENDADELMNLKKPLLTYDWESFTEMIDALVRMRYNVFHFFDALGRPEFFLRPEYIELAPDYQLEMDYVGEMIDYVQAKGMKVQIDLAMGYQPKSLDPAYADCWSQHKDKWKEVWDYYLNETPLGQADIFSLRPRNQVWDWEYKSNCGEEKINVFNEVYAELGEIITSHNPSALKVIVCYSDGMEMFNNGLKPPDDWIVAWSDDGYGEFKELPSETYNYKMGTYMHAGFWKNHTVHHPYPYTIDSIMHFMFDEYNASHYCLVNGQQFRPFIFNLEAFSEVCRDPETFTGDQFYQNWARRYFPENMGSDIIALIKKWDEASFGKAGYVQNLWEIKEVLAFLAEKDITRPGKPPTPSTIARVDNDLEDAATRLSMMENNLHAAEDLLAKLGNKSTYFYDQIYHPLLLYTDLLKFEVSLHELYTTKRQMEANNNSEYRNKAIEQLKLSRKLLEKVYEHSLMEAHDPKWNGWYDPAVRRPNNGFPTQGMLDQIEKII